MFKSKRSTMMSILMVLSFAAGISGLAIVAINGLTTEAEAVMDHDGMSGCDKRVPGEIGECSDGGGDFYGGVDNLP